MNNLWIVVLTVLAISTFAVGMQRTGELHDECERQEVGPGSYVLMEPRGEWFVCI